MQNPTSSSTQHEVGFLFSPQARLWDTIVICRLCSQHSSFSFIPFLLNSINYNDAEGFESHPGWKKHLRPFFLLAEIATTSDNVSMLPYNRSYYLRAPHLLRVGRSPTLPRIGRVPQCARFTHFGGWYVIRSITAPIFGRQVDTALFLASPAGEMNDGVVFRSDAPCKGRHRC